MNRSVKWKRFSEQRLFYPALLVCFIWVAYLPLSSFQFALKNDAFVYNFPNKYFFSECLHHGIIPWWNPYLNFTVTELIEAAPVKMMVLYGPSNS